MIHKKIISALMIYFFLLVGCTLDESIGVSQQEVGVGLSPVTVTGAINQGGDTYRHAIDLYYGGKCVFETELVTLSNSVMRLRDQYLKQLGYDNDGGEGRASRIVETLVPGRYYVDVSGYSSSQTGSYKLHINCFSAIRYRAHVKDDGWLPWVLEGSVAGTTGQSRRLEAVQIELLGTTASVRYKPYVAGVGWMGWFYDGETGGTTGQHRQMEAIRIEIVNDSPNCPVSYQAHVASLGWLGTVSDGVTAGTTGQGRQMEALRVWLGCD